MKKNLKERNVEYNVTFKNAVVSLDKGMMTDHRKMKADLRKPVGRTYSFSYATASYDLTKPKRAYEPKIVIWFYRDRTQKKTRYFLAHHNINPVANACYEALKQRQAEIGNGWPNKQRIEEYLDVCASFGFEEAEIGIKKEKKTAR